MNTYFCATGKATVSCCESPFGLCHDNIINEIFHTRCFYAKGSDQTGKKITARERSFPLKKENTMQEDFLKALLIL